MTGRLSRHGGKESDFYQAALSFFSVGNFAGGIGAAIASSRRLLDSIIE